jgi:hypothetical protein
MCDEAAALTYTPKKLEIASAKLMFSLDKI